MSDSGRATKPEPVGTAVRSTGPTNNGDGRGGARETDRIASPMLFYVTNLTSYFFSHRIELAREATRRGFRVALAGGDLDPFHERIAAEGILPLPIRSLVRGLDPVADLNSGWKLAREIRAHRPAVIHATGLKAMFLCALAGWMTRLPKVVCIVTGLGAIYIGDTPVNRVVRFGMESALRTLLGRTGTTVVFQNRVDRAYFINRRIVRADSSLLIPGSGVDTDEYAFLPEPEAVSRLVVFPARLLKSKGVREFTEAAALLKSRGVTARFALVGDLDPQNPDALSRAELDVLVADGHVEAWGFRADMAAVFAQCHVVCLPSYREGLPKALIEAASAGRAIVTTDAPGCSEVVEHGINGLLVPVRDSAALADAIGRLLQDDVGRRKMGAAGRRRAEAEFSYMAIIGATADLYGPATG